MQPKLSVVIPAYNESKRIGQTLDSIMQFARQCGYPIEVIVAINNTTDDTEQVVARYSVTMPYLRTINCGMHPSESHTKGLAVKAGVLEARGQYVLYMDADDAVELTQIETFWQYFAQGSDVVFGSRYIKGAHIHRAWYRNIMGRLSNLLVQAVLLPGIKDTQCGFKCFTDTVAHDVFADMQTIGWGFDMEFLARARKKGYKLKEAPVTWHEIGHSSVKGGAFLTALEDLFTIRRIVK